MLGARIPRKFALFAACAALGCGSERLQTAEQPARGGSGESPSPSAGISSGGSEAVGGAPSPTMRVELLGLEDFPASYVVGPANGVRFDVNSVAFQQAWRLNMTEPPANAWTAQLVVPFTKEVAAGELLNVGFWLRCEAPGTNGDCYTEFLFERASEPWEKSVAFPSHAGLGWTENSEYFRPVDHYGAGQAHIVFRLGYASQVIDIGGITVQRIAE